MLSCGNKVSPASLITTTNTTDYNSAEPGHMNGLESQHSQASLFSGSEVPSSLELFSQPPNQAESITKPSGSAASENSVCSTGAIKPTYVDTTSQLPETVGRKKYYTKYLSLQSHGNHSSCMVAGGTSVTATANDSDSISSKMQFEAWKDKQQDRLERKQVMTDITEVVNETARKLNSNIDLLREDMRTSLNKCTDKSSSQIEKQTLSLLLKGQEEFKQMMMEMQNEISQQRSVLTSLSKRLSSTATTDTASCLTAVTEKIVQGVTGAFQQAKVCLTSVSTQTTETGHEKSKAADQAVPIDVTIIGESNSRDLYGGANEHAVEASGCSNNKHLSETLPDVANNQLDQKGCLESSICPKSQELVDAKPLWTTSELKNEGTKTADSFVKGTMLGKRKNEKYPTTLKKVPCKPKSVISKKVKPKAKPTATITVPRRRSNRMVKKPMYDVFNPSNNHVTVKNEQNSSQVLLNEGRSKIKRRVSTKQSDRSFSCERTFIESPANALSDALYSETSLEVLSGVQNSQNIPPNSSRTNKMVKFHRRNEAAKRRKMVISNLSDPELLLREIQDCILNRLDANDPSP